MSRCPHDPPRANESKRFPMELPDAVEAIKFDMDQRGSLLEGPRTMIDRHNRLYGFLNRKRPLTLSMI